MSATSERNVTVSLPRMRSAGVVADARAALRGIGAVARSRADATIDDAAGE